MELFDLLIRDCRVLLPDLTVLPNAIIGICQDRIARIEPNAILARDLGGKTTIEGGGKLAMPGLIDCHTHAAQQLLRGSVVDEMPMIWARILVPFESNLTPEDVYAGALLFCVENLKAGITGFADAGGPHMESVAQAAVESGIRANITRSTMDMGEFIPPGMKQTTAEAIACNEKLYHDYHNRGDGRVKIWFGLRQAMTSSPELVEAVSIRSKELGTGVHIHLAEHLDEVSHCLQCYKLRPAEWFDSYGLLGPNLIAAHSVRLSDKEVKLISERKVNAVHCPRANLGSHGFSKTPLLLALGANIALGTDGASSGRLDLFEQMRLLQSAMQARYGLEINDPLALPAVETLRMATINGARAVMLQEEIGTLEVGKKADLILLDIDKPHLSPTAHLTKTIATAAGAEDVNDVIVNGQLLVKDRAFLLLDEEEIRRKAGETLLRVGKRAGLSLAMPYTG
ncbi:MAG: amidohydrolase [Chloroflexi bacterium]|nr:amidohydrolase [Chloroflexota bacterium]